MKLTNFRTVVLVVFISLFWGCEKPVTEVDVARMNAEQYLSELLNRKLKGKGNIVGYNHSDLFILRPLDETKIPKIDTIDKEDEMVAFLKATDKAFNSYQGVSLGLSLGGCDYDVINNVIANDKEYRKYETGAKEYFMITYVTSCDIEGLETIEKGVCFRFSQDINITDVYNIDKEDEDYVYIRAFGQTEGRFYGAIKCEFDYLKRRYEFYDENLRDNKFGTACKCYFIDELNLLFGYQRFEVTEDKEKTVRNCIKQLNSLDDLRELKNSAYAKVKSY